MKLEEFEYLEMKKLDSIHLHNKVENRLTTRGRQCSARFFMCEYHLEVNKKPFTQP